MRADAEAFMMNFGDGFAETARLRELLGGGDANDPQVAMEIARLSELLRAKMGQAFPSALALVEREASNSVVRKTLEAAGLTRERLKQIFDAILSAYDAPEAQA